MAQMLNHGLAPTDTIVVDAPRKYIPPRPAKSMEEILPGRVINILKTVDSVQVFISCNLNDRGCWVKNNILFPTNWSARLASGQLSKEKIKELRTLILNPINYQVYQNPGEIKSCSTTYVIIYIFGSNSDRIALELTPYCSLYLNSLRYKILLEVDCMAKELADFNLSLFPQDSVIVNMHEMLSE
jgi:hypothetical protein